MDNLLLVAGWIGTDDMVREYRARAKHLRITAHAVAQLRGEYIPPDSEAAEVNAATEGGSMKGQLQRAMDRLKEALEDAQANGNDQVRECAFAVIEVWDETPNTVETANRLTRLLSNLSEGMAESCRAYTDIHLDSGAVLADFKGCLLGLLVQVLRFVTIEELQARNGEVHGQ